MPSFFVNRNLSRGDLTLFLRNREGLPQDGYDVRWTVYKNDGRAASGLSLQATRASVGEYFAPWGCARSGGCYYIDWQYGDSPGSPRQSWRQDFFVLETDGCASSCCSRAPAGSPPTIDCGAFYNGQHLGPGDLCIRVLDDDGLPADALIVLWTIFDCRGCPVSLRTQASPGASVGDYCADWVVCGLGSLTVKWEWMLDESSPMESVCSTFSVINPPALLSRCEVPVKPNCPPSPPPNIIIVKECRGGESIPRTVVLPSQVLPVGGQFTNQVSFPFSPAIRHITFYVKYIHGVSGGFPVLRLMWGNGVEEIPSTIINQSFTSFDGIVSTNQMRISDLLGPIPDSDDPIYFMVESSVPGGSTAVRLLVAEGGQIGIPGTAEITLTGSSD